MRSRRVILTAILALSLIGPAVAAPASAQSSQSCSFPVTVTDATGTDVTLQEEPQRVVTLAPSAAQTMWEIGAREKVVGISKDASYLQGTETRTNISGAGEQYTDIEKVVGLNPDLVLAPSVVPNETVETLREAGATVVSFPQAETIENVYEKTRRIGRLAGECSAANTTVSSMNERISTARDAAEGRERPDVLYLFFGFTAGNETFINEIIEAAGGNNIAADANITGYQQVNPEVVIREDPDWIVLNSENPAGVDSDVLNRTTAVQRNQTVVVQIEHLNQAAPRIVRAVTKLTKRFHPDAYAAANTTATPMQSSTTNSPGPATVTRTPAVSTTATSTQSSTAAGSPESATTTRRSTTTPGTGTTGQSGPGFGIPVAIIAILSVGLLLRKYSG